MQNVYFYLVIYLDFMTEIFKDTYRNFYPPLKFSVSWLCNLLEEPWGAQVMLWLFLALFSITWQSELSSFVDGR